ncbi:MAG TPA: hypothetical protein V6C96_04940 [Vampirovibrionales bacterium]
MDLEIKQLEYLGLTKIKEGHFEEAVNFFKEAISKGTQNFQSRLLLTKILADIERGQKETVFEIPSSLKLEGQ